MAKHSMMSKGQTDARVFGLEFIGSIFYLILAYMIAADEMPVSVVFTGSGAFWLPLFAGVAVVSAIGLFIFSFTYLSEPAIISGEHTKNLGLDLAVITGVTFVAMTTGTGYMVLAIGGFILSLVGAMVGYRL
ncbi:MAG: hypothetical protein LVQ97_02440 [Candidatus Micrarchaeales archaeon]|jgi:hypothetical protein|uniref:Uncharacterized protein n=1 Tax=Candidatus Micrarchaeum acidiphilum ARMAN-2 TaxID=425595 RepID=C7DIJ1_MICA2|nr:MAG: hypothetical protein UNLARM2_0879 [Candidatus Micrarchaeum acidiphilum ARMAN-2]MCW6161020.1 hypothetical protein [Candidatus Micrarchaeales archaeon]